MPDGAGNAQRMTQQTDTSLSVAPSASIEGAIAGLRRDAVSDKSRLLDLGYWATGRQENKRAELQGWAQSAYELHFFVAMIANNPYVQLIHSVAKYPKRGDKISLVRNGSPVGFL